MRSFSRFLLTGATLIILSGTAYASLIPSLCGSPGAGPACGATPGVVLVGDEYIYTYNVSLAVDQQLDRSGTTPFRMTSQFLTLYDVPGLILTTAPSVSGALVSVPPSAAAAFTVSTPFVGLSPMEPTCCTPPDTESGPNSMNVLINLNAGVGPIFGGAGVGSSQDFQLIFRSSFNVSPTPNISFSAQALTTGIASLVTNSGLVVGPLASPDSPIPEPTTMLLLGGGLVAVASLHRRSPRN